MRLIRYSYPSTRSFSPAAWSPRSPWSGLEGEIDRLFSSALSDFVAPTSAGRFPVDIYEDKDHTYVRAELPGVAREAIAVEVVDGFLNLSATRQLKTGEREESFALSRSVALGDEVDSTKVSAAYEHGVLTVTLPKKESAKPRKISVAVN